LRAKGFRRATAEFTKGVITAIIGSDDAEKARIVALQRNGQMRWCEEPESPLPALISINAFCHKRQILC